MPHKCTGCGRQFADGSKEMLSGCPDCGGTKFQFMPAGGAPAAEEPPEPPQPERSAVAETVGAATTKLRDFVGDGPGPTGGEGSPGESSVGGEGSAGHSSAGGEESPDQSSAGGDGSPGDPAATGDAVPVDGIAPEDGAQSSARSEMVSADELPGGPPTAGAATTRDAEPEAPVPEGTVTDDAGTGRVVDTPAEDRPDLAELREELNDQFEGIRICERGEYELNLMELYEREETIIALQENGRYVIEPPESWHGD